MGGQSFKGWSILELAEVFLFNIKNGGTHRIYCANIRSKSCLIIISCHAAVKEFCLPLVLGEEKSMLSENQRKIFADFHNSVDAEGTLDEKTSHMIKVAAAMAFGCYP